MNNLPLPVPFNLELQKELYKLLCDSLGIEIENWYKNDILASDDKDYVVWFQRDLGKLLSFRDPQKLVEVYNLILEKYGGLHLTIGIKCYWCWDNVEWRGRNFKASTFYSKINLGNGNEPLKSYAEKPPLYSFAHRKPPAYFSKSHPLVEIQSLFCVRDAFELPKFTSYNWDGDGFCIYCNNKKHTKNIFQALKDFMGDEAEEIGIDLQEKTVCVALK